MNIRFDPVTILDVNTINYCSYCSAATFADLVHSNNQCVLSELHLICGTEDETVMVNFEFYHCFFKNCTFSSRGKNEFNEHLTAHGISLDNKISLDNHKSTPQPRPYKCPNCPYAATQKRYLASHQLRCDGEQAESSTTSASCGGTLFQPKRKRVDSSEKQTNSIKRKSVATPESAKSRLARKHRCTNCPYATTQARFLENHMKTCQKHDSSEIDNVNENSTSKTQSDLQFKAKSKTSRSNIKEDISPSKGIKIIATASFMSHSKSPDTSDDNCSESNDNTFLNKMPSSGKVKGHKHQCPTCNYSTTQDRYLQKHLNVCQFYTDLRYKCSDDRSEVEGGTQKQWSANVISSVAKSESTASNSETSENILLDEKQKLKDKLNKPYINIKGNMNIKNVARKKILSKIKQGAQLRITDQKYFKENACPPKSVSKARSLSNENPMKIDSSPFFQGSTSPVKSTDKSKCPHCPHTCRPSIMIYHQKKCTSGLYEDFRCSICHDIMSSLKRFQIHVAKHKSAVIPKKDILKVPRKSKFSDKRINHRKKDWSCPNCPYKTIRTHAIASHASLCGSDKNAHRCSKCNYLSEHITNYHRHITTCTQGLKPPEFKQETSDLTPFSKQKNSQCSTCSFQNKDLKVLKSHMLLCKKKIAENEISKILTCSEAGCNFLSRSKKGLHLHFRRLHENNEETLITKGSSIAEQTMNIAASKFESNLASLGGQDENYKEEFYSCEICSYRCPLNDTTMIESHKEFNCRMQLFDKFKILEPKNLDTINFDDKETDGISDETYHCGKGKENLVEELEKHKNESLVFQQSEFLEDCPSFGDATLLKSLSKNSYESNGHQTSNAVPSSAELESRLITESSEPEHHLQSDNAPPSSGDYPDIMPENDILDTDPAFGHLDLCLESEYFL